MKKIGDWLSASFTRIFWDEKRDYYKFKVLYWDESARYVTELDYAPLDDFWYSATYFNTYSKPAVTFDQKTWTY